MAKISLCMVIRNGEKTLPPIFKKLSPIVDEIVVVDQDSDDKTREVCEKFNVYYHKATRKNLADIDRNTCYNIATGDVVLALDDDEMPDKKMLSFLRKVKEQGLEHDVYWFKFRNTVDGVDIHSILGDDWHPRVWKRDDSKMQLIDWPVRAHTFPKINTHDQFFSTQGKVDHVRSLKKIRRVTEERAKAMDGGNIQIEQNFLARVEQLVSLRKRK